jgi:phosphate transport system substrate-binding protein
MMQDLAELLRDGEFRGKEVIFAGFGVSDDGSQAAMTASSEAASEMQAAFSQFAPEVILSGNLGLSSYGFGSVAPVTCYEGQVASATHTRVEVWIR